MTSEPANKKYPSIVPQKRMREYNPVGDRVAAGLLASPGIPVQWHLLVPQSGSLTKLLARTP